MSFRDDLIALEVHLPAGVVEGLVREFDKLEFPRPVVKEHVVVKEIVTTVANYDDKLRVAELEQELRAHEAVFVQNAELREKIDSTMRLLETCLVYLREYGPRSIYSKVEAVIEVLHGKN